MMAHNNIFKSGYSNWQIIALTVLRVLIGWHFLYEGLYKVISPAWSSRSYLESSTGPFATVFRSLAETDALLQVADFLNIWGLVLIGFCLFIGLFSKISAYLGMILLFFYYISFPPFGDSYSFAYVDGNYWIVNRNLIEIVSLLILIVFPSSHITGLDRFIFKTNRTGSKID